MSASMTGWGTSCEIIDWSRQWRFAVEEIESGSRFSRHGQPTTVGGGIRDDKCVSWCIVGSAALVI